MAMKIVILEDNVDRQAVMRECLADRFYMYEAQFFDDSCEMIHYLEAHLTETILIALDNDLDMKMGQDGRLFDPGDGCQVADFLAKQAPVCPVIIHTTNTTAAETINRLLRGAGWETRRVIPFDDMEWIKTDWFFAVRRAIVGHINQPQR